MTTSAELQREAETARAGLSSTLDELRLSMTRTALTSGATALAREGSATVMRAAVRRASDNPLAALLIGAGVVMLFSRGNGSSLTGGLFERTTGAVRRAVQGASDESAEMADTALDRAAKVKQAAIEKAHDVQQSIRETASNVQQSARETASNVQQSVRETAGNVQQSVRETASTVQKKVGEVSEKTRRLTMETMDRTTTQMNRMVQEQPILLAALAVAAGAVLGAALPVTETERRRIGPAAARAATRGREVAERVSEAVSGKVEEAVSAATDTSVSEVLGGEAPRAN